MNQFRFAVDNVAGRLGANWQSRLVAAAETQFAEVVYLTNNDLPYPNDPFPNRLYAGAKRVVLFTGENDLQTLSDFHQKHRCPLVGYIGYDLKNQLETLQSRHENRLGFSDIWFIEPLYIVDFEQDSLLVQTDLPDAGPWAGWLDESGALPDLPVPHHVPAVVQARVEETEYVATVQQIRALIEAGDVYELNYCIEFFAEKLTLDPLTIYLAL